MTEITRTVYSLYWPETREIVDRLWSERHHEWYERNYDKGQDDMHWPLLRDWPEWAGVQLGQAFPNSYPTNGASEVINNLIVPTHGGIHVFRGEYEGYKAIAEARDMRVTEHDRSVDTARNDRIGHNDQFWISHPSAIDGCYWNDLESFLLELAARRPNVKVHLDLTYVGATPMARSIEPVRFPNVATVLFSLSKPFGAYYHRIGGCYSRTPIASLWGNGWFKNLFGVHLGHALISAVDRTELPRRYRQAQIDALATAVEDGEVPATAKLSDVVLLAHDCVGRNDMRRADHKYRFCLTPLMDAAINGTPKGER